MTPRVRDSWCYLQGYRNNLRTNMRLYIPRAALPGAASTASSSQLRQLVGCTTPRASLYFRSPSYQDRRFLALPLSPLQLHKRVSPPLRCRRHGEGMGMSQGCGWWVQERRIAATAVVGMKKTSYPPRPKVKEEEIEEKYLKGR